VIIEADAWMMDDPIFQTLQKRERNQYSDLFQCMHSFSTNTANQQLVVALMRQRNIVMDGTLSWLPFVTQTVQMVRNAHNYDYFLGEGYVVDKDKKITEAYWKKMDKPSEEEQHDVRRRLPYRVEMVGVTVDPAEAVARGIRRYMATGRGVPISGQLRSHRLFSENFESYLSLFDRTVLYDLSSGNCPPQIIGLKEDKDQLSLLQEPIAYAKFLRKKRIRDNANGKEDLYEDQSSSAISATSLEYIPDRLGKIFS